MMSLSSLKLNPNIARSTSNGQIQCLVCNIQVKVKVWTAHVNGKKHKDSISRLRQQLTGTAGPKRQSEDYCIMKGAPPIKKAKENPESSLSDNPNGSLPADFFDEDPGLNIQTPWQQSRQEESFLMKEKKGVIEGVPQGFFDDKKMDDRVRETMERNAQLDDEYDKLMREVNEQQFEEEAKADEEAEREARQRDISNIDEQIIEWQRLNDMEKRKEERLRQGRERQKKYEADSDESDTSECDFGNWRAKRIL